MASELAEARSRISELEGLTVDDAKTVERVTFHLQQSGRICSLMSLAMAFNLEAWNSGARGSGNKFSAGAAKGVSPGCN